MTYRCHEAICSTIYQINGIKHLLIFGTQKKKKSIILHVAILGKLGGHKVLVDVYITISFLSLTSGKADVILMIKF